MGRASAGNGGTRVIACSAAAERGVPPRILACRTTNTFVPLSFSATGDDADALADAATLDGLATCLLCRPVPRQLGAENAERSITGSWKPVLAGQVHDCLQAPG